MPFTFNVPASVLVDHLERERKTGSRYSDSAVRISLLLDLDRGSLKNKAHYARLWRWHYRVTDGKRLSEESARMQVRRQWGAIVADVLSWATNDGRTIDHWRPKIPPEWWALSEVNDRSWVQKVPDRQLTGERPGVDRKNGETSPESPPVDRQLTGERPGVDRHTKQTYQTSNLSGLSVSGGDGQIFNPIEVFERVFPDQRLVIFQREQIQCIATNMDVWTATLNDWKLNYPHLSHQVGNILNSYKENVENESRKAEQNRDQRNAGNRAGKKPKRRGAWHPGRSDD